MAADLSIPAPPVAPGTVALRPVRRWWRAIHPPPSIARRLDVAYITVLGLGIVGALAYGTTSSVLSRWITPDAAATWGPSVALVVLWAVSRWGSVQGPVVYAAADVGHLLQAPLSRRALAVPRLLRNLGLGAVGGLVLAAVALVGLGGQGRGVTFDEVAGLAGGLALCGVLGMAAAGAVEGSAAWDRVTRLAGLPVIAVAAGLVVLADSGSSGRAVARWSGPWGWAVQPVVGVAPRHWVFALIALAVVTAGAAAAVVRGCGRWPAERHELRAAARAGAIASLYAFDARTARLSLSRVGSRAAGGRARRVRLPRRADLAIPWRDWVAALSAPVVLVQAVALAAAGTALTLIAADRPAAGAAGALVAYFGASRLLEPLRAETDSSDRTHVLLPTELGRVLLAHALVPAVAVAVGGLLAVIGCAATGELPAHGGAVALIAVLATPTITLCAANSSRRGGRVPPSVMATTTGADPSGGGLVLAWLVAWPVAGAILGGGPAILVSHSGTSALFFAAVVALIVPPVLALVLGREVTPS